MAEYNPSKIIKDGNTYNFRDDTKIPLAGSNAISGSLIPSATNSYNFGSPTARWNNAYATTFNGDVVGSGTLTLQSNSGTARILLRNNDASGFPNSVNLYSKVDNVEYGVFLNGGNFFPTIDGEMNFGYLQRRWKDCYTKAINGLNPGALSLPGTSVNVDTTNWVLDGSNVNSFTPANDGWLGIQVTDTVYDQMHYVFVGRYDNASYYSQNVLSPINALWDSKYHGCIFIPVIKGISYHIRCICSTIVATFYPCQGNI